MPTPKSIYDKKLPKRYLYRDIISLALKRNKMAFISGPRQVGKTTLAKSLGPDFDQFVYKNWDESRFRKLWAQAPNDTQKDFDLTLAKKSKGPGASATNASGAVLWRERYTPFGEKLLAPAANEVF
jgi:predicted AAA+ superfamily ATPase